MHVGFTGTQRGMNEAQWRTVWSLLLARATEPNSFHHGDCIGADAQSVTLARAAGFWIVGHPPTNESKRAFVPADESMMPRTYLARNKVIVIATAELIATPGEFDEQQRSGTWSTVRYARRLGRPVHVVLPDGSVQR